MKLSLIFLIFISMKLWQVSACKSKEVERKFNEGKNSSEVLEVGDEVIKNLKETDKSFKELTNGLSGKEKIQGRKTIFDPERPLFIRGSTLKKIKFQKFSFFKNFVKCFIQKN